MSRTDPTPPVCHVEDDGCITCGDVAVVLRVLSTDGHDATCEDEHGRREVVAVDLVGALAGDLVLAHAKVALEVVVAGTPLGRVGAAQGAKAPAQATGGQR